MVTTHRTSRGTARLASAALAAIGTIGIGSWGAAPAAAASPAFDYSCTALDGTITDTWTVSVNPGFPSSMTAGQDYGMDITIVTAKSGTASADALRKRFQPTTFEMKIDLGFRFGDGSGHFYPLVDGTVDFPDEGESMTYAYDGPGEFPDAPEKPGTYDITVDDLTIDMTLEREGTSTAVRFTCTPRAGEDTVLTTVDVLPADSSTPPDASQPPAEGEATPSGPPVETGVRSSDGTTGTTLALGALAVGGVAAVTTATRRRRDS